MPSSTQPGPRPRTAPLAEVAVPVAKGPITGDQPPSAHGDRRERVAAAIVELIVAGELAGGDRLVTQELANRFHVSMTPVREALAELAGIGIVDLVPNRGAIVHKFSRQEIRDVCRVRRALECEAVRGAIGRIPPSQLRSWLNEFQTLASAPVRRQRMIRRARELDSLLHDAVARYCGNVFLQRELARLTRLFRSLRDASWVDAQARDDCDRLAEEAAEHGEIATALLAKDRPRAVAAMSRHIAASARYWSPKS